MTRKGRGGRLLAGHSKYDFELLKGGGRSSGRRFSFQPA
jgi:hypothetical protein